MLTDHDRSAIPHTPEDTTVIGNMDSDLHWYIKSGRALRDWNRAIAELKKRFEKEVAEFPHLWDHIIIPDRSIHRRKSPIMERLTEVFHS